MMANDRQVNEENDRITRLVAQNDLNGSALGDFLPVFSTDAQGQKIS